MENLTIKEKLTQVFKLNKKNLKDKNKNLIEIVSDSTLIKNVYYKLKHKKKIVHRVDLKILKDLSEQIKIGIYQWNNNKFLKHKKVLNFKNQIVQKLIEIVLSTIYEPIFQTLEYNNGLRFKKSISITIQKLKLQNQKWIYGLKSQITEKSVNINHKIFIKILKKKIEDSLFFKLFQTLLKNKSISFILYNIYMHEFDLYVSKKIKNLKNKEIWLYSNDFRFCQKFISKNDIMKQKVSLGKIKLKNKVLNKFNIIVFQKLQKIFKKQKNEKRNFKTANKQNKKIQIIYNRYNNNWIMLTNYDFPKIQKLKKKLTKWFKKNLKINLKKIIMIDLLNNKLNYLGFTLYIVFSRIKKMYYKNKIKGRRKTTTTLFVGVDHEYLKSKLVKKQILTPKHRPNHINAYYNLKLTQILSKFRQKLKILTNYYSDVITHSSDLNYYHYIYKFSLLKTIAHKTKKSVTYASLNYLNNLEIQKDIKVKNNFLQYEKNNCKNKSIFNQLKVCLDR